MKKKQTLALLLAGAMLVPNAFAASPEDFHDFPTDWSAAGLRSAVDNGLLNGANGRIDGAGLLTRAQMAAVLTCAKGTSMVTESIFDNRFRYVDELRRMGANISVEGRVAVIEGVDRLKGAPVKATDLRAGAALIIAALSADGITEIYDIFHVERGYENMEVKLRSLGADIIKVDEPDPAADAPAKKAI